MVRSKREWVCSECAAKYIKWQGICKCGKAGTLKENILIPIVVKPKATLSQKSLNRRSKNSERNIGRRMLEADGPDPMFKNIASSTGRIGHITNMQIDAVSRSYVTENKNRKIPSWMVLAWTIINQKAAEFGKNALLHIEPPNMPRDIPVNGTKQKLDSLAIITQSRHEDLIRTEKALALALNVLETDSAYTDTLQEIYQVLHPHSNSN